MEILSLTRCLFSSLSIFKMKKEKSKLQRTPQKNDQGKRKTSPTKKESESKKSRLTPKKDNSVNSVKKETNVRPRGLDFKEQVAKETNGDARARNLADDSSENQVENLLWVDKYKPTSLKTIIGQQGDQSCANKLLRWLQNWHKSPSEDKKHGDCTASLIFICLSPCTWVRKSQSWVRHHSASIYWELALNPGAVLDLRGAVVSKIQSPSRSSQAVGRHTQTGH